MTKKLPELKSFSIDGLTFPWQGTNISLGMTVGSEGNRYLTVRVGGVGAAVRITDSPTGNWTILIQAESSQGVGVMSQDGVSICVGPAQSATASATADTQD